MLAGAGLAPQAPLADATVRDHVIRGSGSKWAGSQYISTTADLSTAVKYAAPFNPIVKIDIASFVSMGGGLIDLSTREAFEAQVPPDDGEAGMEERSAVLRRFRAAHSLLERMLPPQHPLNDELRLRDAEFLYEQAAHSPWECARLFAARSQEILLIGPVDASCVEVVSQHITTTGVWHLPCGKEIPVRDLGELQSPRPQGGSNSGRVLCTLAGEELELQQAKPNPQPDLLSASALRYAVDASFAAFSLYRLVDTHLPEFMVHVRDCAKITFNVSVEGLNVPLGCLVFRQPRHSLTPLRVGYQMLDSRLHDALSEVSPIPLGSRKLMTPDDVVERWKAKAHLHPFSEEDEARFRTGSAGIETYAVQQMIAPEFARKALAGVALDIMMANVYGWGVYDDCDLAFDEAGKLYRLAADEALGNVVVTEHLNFDRREPAANLCLNTLTAAVGGSAFIDLPPPRYTEMRDRPLTYEDTWGNFPQQLACQFTELLDCIESNTAAFEEVFKDLSVPPEVQRLASMYPETKHLADLPSELLWRDYAHERCASLQKATITVARSQTARAAAKAPAEQERLWGRLKQYAARLLDSAGLLSKVLRQRPELADLLSDHTSSVVETSMLTPFLVDFTAGAASAVPFKLQDSDSTSQFFSQDLGGGRKAEELLRCAAELTHKGNPWAAANRIRPSITREKDLVELLAYAKANPSSHTANCFMKSFVLKMAAHDALDEQKPDELVVDLLADALICDRKGATLLLGPSGATTTKSYFYQVTVAANRVLTRRPSSVKARLVLAAHDLVEEQARLYDEAVDILLGDVPNSAEEHHVLSRVLEYAAENRWVAGESEAALRLWSKSFDTSCRAEMVGKLSDPARPSVELLYALGFCLTNYRPRGEAMPDLSDDLGDLSGEIKEQLADYPSQDLLHELLPINLQSAKACLSIYLKCAKPDSPKLAEAHYSLGLDDLAETTRNQKRDRDQLCAALPRWKEHLSKGDAAFKRRPRLIAYDKARPGIGVQFEAMVKMLELGLAVSKR